MKPLSSQTIDLEVEALRSELNLMAHKSLSPYGDVALIWNGIQASASGRGQWRGFGFVGNLRKNGTSNLMEFDSGLGGSWGSILLLCFGPLVGLGTVQKNK
ncbi:hypothetical protein AHAS_Ahas15G0063500 [Arachis hypogaea]